MKYPIHPLISKPPMLPSRGPKTADGGINKAEWNLRDRQVEQMYQLLLRENDFLFIYTKHDHQMMGDKEFWSFWEFTTPKVRQHNDPVIVQIRRVRKNLCFSINKSAFKPLSYALLKGALSIWDVKDFKTTSEVEAFEKEGLYIRNIKGYKYLQKDKDGLISFDRVDDIELLASSLREEKRIKRIKRKL